MYDDMFSIGMDVLGQSHGQEDRVVFYKPDSQSIPLSHVIVGDETRVEREDNYEHQIILRLSIAVITDPNHPRYCGSETFDKDSRISIYESPFLEGQEEPPKTTYSVFESVVLGIQTEIKLQRTVIDSEGR